MKKSLKILLIIVGSLLGLFVAGYFILAIIGTYFTEEDQYNEEPTEQKAVLDETGAEYADYEYYDDEDSAPASDKWTVMVYLCGTDLETKAGAASFNLYEMLSAEFSDSVDLVIETGGTQKWQTEELSDSFDGVDRIRSDELGYYSIKDHKLIFEKSEAQASMGEPETLSGFISWCAQNHPADKYMLILWDHGGGSCGGVCCDELYEMDSLSVSELREAVTDADVPIEVIGFDACLMASLETAEALQGYGHYMVASEEIEPGSGWDYIKMLEELSADPGMDGLELGKGIADGFMEKCVLFESGDMITLSVTDLTRIPALTASFRDYAAEMLLSTEEPARLRAISMSAAKAENYGGNTNSEGYTDMVDLGDLLDHTDDLLNWSADRVTKALNDAVKYEVHGKNRKYANGISVFYPLAADETFTASYMKISNNPAMKAYTGFMRKESEDDELQFAGVELPDTSEIQEGKYDSFFNEGRSPVSDYEPSEDTAAIYEAIADMTPMDKEEYKISYVQSLSDDGHYKVEITSGAEVLQEVSFILYYMNPESNEVLYLGSDNLMNGDFGTGVFTDAFNGSWITVGGEYVCAELMEQNDDYNLYTIPVKVNGKSMNMRAEYDKRLQSYNIIGICDGIDEETGQAGRDVRKLKAGDEVEFLLNKYDFNSGLQEYVSIGEITWSNDVFMNDGMLEDGIYQYTFCMKDIFGNETESEPVYKKIENGDVMPDE